MTVLIFHGYLLRGTGSNVYNANLAQALARLGHEVHLLCQDREAASLDWVDAVGTWESGELALADAAGSAPGEGSITAYLPDIGGAPAAVRRRQLRGFDVQAVPGSERGGGRVATSRRTWRRSATSCARAGGIDAALANHLVMGPVILARAADALGPFAAKVHGSALSYTVIPTHASCPTPARAWRRRGRCSSAPATPRRASGRPSSSTACARRPASGRPASTSRPSRRCPSAPTAARRARGPGGRARVGGAGRGSGATRRGRRGAALLRGRRRPAGHLRRQADRLEGLRPAARRLAARRRRVIPGARLLMVGFGEYRDGLRRLAGALAAGDLEDARESPRLGWALEGGEEEPLTPPRRVPRRSARRLRRRRPGRRRQRRLGRPARVRRGRGGGPLQRRDGRAEHVPGGVRDGRRRGRLDRRAAGLRRPLRPCRGRGGARRAASRRHRPTSPRSRSSRAIR